MTERTEWAESQIRRIHGPILEARRLKTARMKRRLKYDGFIEYRWERRRLRADGRIWRNSVDLGVDF